VDISGEGLEEAIGETVEHETSQESQGSQGPPLGL